MQAVILAGGEGRRLRPLTYKVPKPMVVINGRPFLEYQLGLLRSCGIRDILILLGYLGGQIEGYLGNGASLGLDIDYSHEEELLGTGGALKKAEDKLQDKFLVLNGDTFLPVDYEKVIRYADMRGKIGTLVAYNNLDSISPNNIKIDESNLVIGYNKRNDSGMNYLDAGLMVFKKEVINFIDEGRKTSLEEEVFQKLIEIKELMAYPTNQRFYDIGNPEGMGLLEERLK